MRVAVLGAPGARGRRVVRDLLDRPEVTDVVLVGPAERDLSRLVGALDPRRVTAVPVPLTVEGIAEGFRDVDVAVGSLDAPEVELTALESASTVGIGYVTSCEDPDTIRAMRAASFSQGTAGATIIAGMSWSPGLSNILVRDAAEQLDHVRGIRVAWCTSRFDEGADGLDRLLAGWGGEAQVIAEGALRAQSPGSLSERVFFPEPVGWQRVHLVRGGEVVTLPDLFGDLESLTVEGGMAGASASTLAQLVTRSTGGDGAGLTEAPAGATRRRLGVLARSVALGIGPLSPPASGWSGLRVDVTGRTGGSARVVTYGVVDHLPNLETVPLVEAALAVGRGEVTARGVLAPEVALEAPRFLALLAQRGVRVARLLR
jgi:lysine 6-dehydrogenase